MPGIPRELAEHALHVDPDVRPVRQTMQRVSEPHHKAIGEEINRLTKANFIREIKQATWVANPVLVPKKNTKILRMCMDFTSLNKHCPKITFPYLGSIKSSILRQDADDSPFSMLIQDINRYE